MAALAYRLYPKLALMCENVRNSKIYDFVNSIGPKFCIKSAIFGKKLALGFKLTTLGFEVKHATTTPWKLCDKTVKKTSLYTEFKLISITHALSYRPQCPIAYA